VDLGSRERRQPRSCPPAAPLKYVQVSLIGGRPGRKMSGGGRL